MIINEKIRLAKTTDAQAIAEMSRDLIETGLGWSWTTSRVIRDIRGKQSNVIVASDGRRVSGFAIMQYMESEASINLLGVHPEYRRQGIGKRLVKWLEKTAMVNGNGVIYLETRLKNQLARDFYQSLGYKIVQRVPGYYNGRETAIRMAHDLWSDIGLRGQKED